MTDRPEGPGAAGHDPATPSVPPAPRRRRDLVDHTSEASFPASDPPSWMGMPPGGPTEEEEDGDGPRRSEPGGP